MTASMPRLILRGLRSTVVGAVIGAALCALGYLPAVFVEVSGSTPDDTRTILVGVALIGARAGAVAGLIFFLVKRSLTGEVADPRESSSSR